MVKSVVIPEANAQTNSSTSAVSFSAPSSSSEATEGWLEVIGAGLCRTGTMSTRAALEVLLRGPWYHGTVPVGEAPHHVHTWATSLASGRLQPEAADLLKGYKAGLDITVFAFYKELMVLHPRAKVLLTVREARGGTGAC